MPAYLTLIINNASVNEASRRPSLAKQGVMEARRTSSRIEAQSSSRVEAQSSTRPDPPSGGSTRAEGLEGKRAQLKKMKSLMSMDDRGKGEMFFREKCSNKGEVLNQLNKAPFLEPDNPGFFHGRIYKTCPPAPVVGWACSDNPR